MFGSIFGGPRVTEPAPNAPQQPAQPTQPTPPVGPNNTATNVPLAGAAPQASAAPAAPTAPPTINDIISRLAPQSNQAETPDPSNPMQFAQDFIGSMMQTPTQQTEPSAPRINPVALREAFSTVDFTTGLDMETLTEALQGRGADGTDPAALTRAALQSQGLNIITAIAPLMNQMVQTAMEQAVTQASTRTHHGLTSQSLVTEFVQQHPYANNPLMLGMVREFCNTIVAQNPQQIDRKAIFNAIDLAFQGMSQTIRPNDVGGQQNLPHGAQSGFGDLFN